MNAQSYNDKYYPIFVPHPMKMRHPMRSQWLDLREQPTVRQVEEFQAALNLKMDGYLGPTTIHKASLVERAAMEHRRGDPPNGIVVGPRFIESVSIPVESFIDDFTLGDTATRTRRQKPTQIVLHYDVAWNARAAESILQKRGYSTHFIIDGDRHGTIFQCHNPATKTAFHCGAANDYSIGIDLNNPADPSYAKRDAEKRGRERGMSIEKIHGYDVERLGYFPEQIDSLVWLLRILCAEFEIPMVVPRDNSGDVIKGKMSKASKFKGILGHYHLSTRKTDPSPLDWDDLETRLFHGDR